METAIFAVVYIIRFVVYITEIRIMQLGLFLILSLTSAIALTLLGLQLWGIHIPRKEETCKLRTARAILSVAYLILAASAYTVFFCKTEHDPQTVAVVTIATAAFQSLLFTATLLTFIRPLYVTKARTLKQTGGVTILVCLFVLLALNNHTRWVFYLGASAYVLQLVYYTRLFRRQYAERLKQLEAYYDDDQREHLRWVKFGFYAALAVGITAIASVWLPPMGYNVFILAYVTFYAWFASRFSNYAAKLNYYLPAITQPMEEQSQVIDTAIAGLTAEELSRQKEQLKRSLEQWVANSGYIRQEESKEQIAQSLGTEPAFMRWYFSTQMPQDFRSWRVSLRIEYAKRLLVEDPDISMNALARKIGFNTRSNFYGYFKKVTGETPLEFQKRITSED